MASNFLSPFKISDQEVLQNSMREEDVQSYLKPPPEENAPPRWGPAHKGAKTLASLYDRRKRFQEWISFIAFAVFMIIDGYLILYHFRLQNIPTLILSFILGVILAEILVGLGHWIFDTWGSIDIPYWGVTFIRPFREHHVDPSSIIRHDFIETNADNALAAVPFLIWVLWRLLTYSADEIQDHYLSICSFYIFSFLEGFANQIHKWAHIYNGNGVPKWVTWMQDHHLLLSRKNHRYHHVAPHNTYYCITTGWLNYPLELLHIWPAMEVVISFLTGAKPRADDMSWAKKR